MFIIKAMLDPIQLEFKKSQYRGKLFIAVLLAILMPAVGSRSSQILRKEMGKNFHLLSRLRTNSKLFNTRVPRYSGRGRPAKYGKCVGNVKSQGKDRKKKAKKYDVFIYGRKRTVRASSEIFYLKTFGMPVLVVWTYYRKNMVALFTTDLSLSVDKILNTTPRDGSKSLGSKN